MGNETRIPSLYWLNDLLYLMWIGVDRDPGKASSILMDLTGKVVVITGASRGIGEALAKLFADHLATVVMLSRDAARAEAAASRIGHPERTLALACDVQHREEIDRVVGIVTRNFQRIDVWVNNAGQGLLDSIDGADMAACREIFETNLFGTIAALQAVAPTMKQQSSGTIINISSVAGHIPVPFMGIYCATKFAMNAIGKAARVELKKHGIHVLTVCPGYVRTEFGANALRGQQAQQIRPSKVRGITPERVARAVFQGCVKQKREVIVPWTMIPVIKIYQLLPGFVERVMAKMAGAAK
jgi:short-subunit dehydrogenase